MELEDRINVGDWGVRGGHSGRVLLDKPFEILIQLTMMPSAMAPSDPFVETHASSKPKVPETTKRVPGARCQLDTQLPGTLLLDA
jgi:hypothetical protein